jgi:hypothetical protein
MAAAALVVGAMPLRPGDRLIVRAPVEGDDVPPNNLDGQTYVQGARSTPVPNVTRGIAGYVGWPYLSPITGKS